MFADEYLAKNNRSKLIDSPPEKDCGMIVVIPCLRETELLLTLQSLNKCKLPASKVEVIVLINQSENASPETVKFNQETKCNAITWINENRSSGIAFYIVGPVELPKKWAGAGLARKTGMDEAILRFNQIGNAEGIIVSLDADTLVDENYLFGIEKYFKLNTRSVGATIAFEHQKTGLDEKHRLGIDFYEKYLWYYKNVLQFTGFPYAMFTVGSAFAVKADAYVKRGGMNRRQAGEDFYFLQNLVQIGKVGEIDSVKVYPSARLSDRVPFGTGPVLQKWMDGNDDLLITYSFEAFSDLKKLFDRKEELFKIKVDYPVFLDKLPLPLKDFLNESDFKKEIDDLNRNCSSIKSFNQRFFQKFNAFKVLKYLNFVHEKYYKKGDLESQIAILTRLKTNP